MGIEVEHPAICQDRIIQKTSGHQCQPGFFCKNITGNNAWDKITRHLEMGDLVKGRQHIFTKGKLCLTNQLESDYFNVLWVKERISVYNLSDSQNYI